jgi:membrane-bound lytic murein transglycosylase A
LIDKGVPASGWDEIQKWYESNPASRQEMLNINPRYVFFNLKPLPNIDTEIGPTGSEGVPLTPGRSVAIDVKNISLGTPLWLSTSGPSMSINKMVIAQDTGSAITGPIRLDYFTGWGHEAGNVAGQIKQTVKLWVILPKTTTE